MTAPRFLKISDFCETGSGTTPSRQKLERYYGGSIPWVKSGELRESEITQTEESVTETALRETTLKLVPAGALLVAMYGATVGRVGRLGIEATTNQAVCHILPDPSLADNHYIFHALCAKATELIAKGVGGAQPNISQRMIKNTEIYLPSLEEQKRIASVLEQANALRRTRQRSVERLNTLSQALFYEMFGDPSSNPRGWPVGTIRDLVGEVKYGTAKKAHTEPRGLPVLRMGNITYDGCVDTRDLKYVELLAKEVPKYTTRYGDILFNRTNSKDLVGKTAVFTEPKPMAIAGYLVRARVNEHADPFYISAYLNSKHGKKTLRSMCKNIVGMANINAQEFQDITILMPPVEAQIAFGKKVEALSAAKETFTAHLRKLDALFISLQQRAFRGEL
ncbi:restriction endonuclease subunit S [Tepidicaulis sp.]|uniref:restriction endonuclease subunit S n=1 Tax=Tepidicaulis sp. TaxID=1920809 RepID=UPI003B5954AA